MEHWSPRARPTSAPRTRRARDEGSTLILALVLVIVGGLIVVPMLTYASTVIRANRVTSSKREDSEATKAALRIALADPISLYEHCASSGPTLGKPLATPPLSEPITSTCYLLDTSKADNEDAERVGLSAVMVGETAPLTDNGSTFDEAAGADDWLAETTDVSTEGKIWLPSLSPRVESSGSAVGKQYGAGWDECNVFFPGTYVDPIVLDGPTYFVSGVYYFEAPITVLAGADVVAGAGVNEGCTTDADSIWVDDAPSRIYADGVGATFVFGKAGRLVIDPDDTASVSFIMNRRYVSPDESPYTASAGVSIQTVNGEWTGASGGDLQIAGALHVPESVVLSSGNLESPLDHSYEYSILTPRPTVPDAPLNVAAQAYASAAVISWDAPNDGGSSITAYRVTNDRDAQICETNGATSCVFTGLTNGSMHTFSVVAVNAAGESAAATAQAKPLGTAPALQRPDAPTSVSITAYVNELNTELAVEIRWSAPADDGGAPITSYTATVHSGGAECTVDTTVADIGELTCVVRGLDPTDPPSVDHVNVMATNVEGDSARSTDVPVNLPAAVVGIPADNPAPPTPSSSRRPDAIVDIDVTSGSEAHILIDGYISAPQGRIVIDSAGRNPQTSIELVGGVLASMFDADTDFTEPGLRVGYQNTVVQQTVRIVSRQTDSGVTSDAVVQINQNGAYAINTWEIG